MYDAEYYARPGSGPGCDGIKPFDPPRTTSKISGDCKTFRFIESGLSNYYRISDYIYGATQRAKSRTMLNVKILTEAGQCRYPYQSGI